MVDEWMNGVWMICGVKKKNNQSATIKVKFLSFSAFQHFSSCTQCLINYIQITDSNSNKGFTHFKIKISDTLQILD